MILPVPSLPTSYSRSCKKLLISIFNISPATTKLAAAAAATRPRPRWSHSQMGWPTATTAVVVCRRHSRKDHHHQQPPQQQKQKIVVIMGATGSGKSRLSIDLATRFFPSEIINSDKMQVYRTLDITTNKIPMHERLDVPHHLIGDVDSSSDHPELTPSEFRSLAASAISGIASRRKLPLVVGGSNSFIYALAANRFDPASDVFRETRPDPVSTDLRYRCCFLWVDVSMAVLNKYLVKRVDDMLESGMFEELAEYFKSDEFGESDSVTRTGLRKAIGVPELEPYFRRFPGGVSPNGDPVRRAVYEEAVRSIKENTCRLAKRQVRKIERLSSAGWDLQRVDATAAFAASMGLDGSDFAEETPEIWQRQVVQPSVKIVKRFLEEE